MTEMTLNIFISMVLFIMVTSSATALVYPFESNKAEQMFFDFFMEKKIDVFHNLFVDRLNTAKTTNSFDVVHAGLPDLAFIELKAWWGPINTSSVGLFVRYGVINYGGEINRSVPIESNLSFFADGNKSSFGYIIQKPLLYPTHWYPGEILGGCYFFDIDEKPSNITAVIDYNQSIQELNENNNQKSIAVVTGIQLNGSIYESTSNGKKRYKGMIELSGCDRDSLSTFSYRTFRTDENGSYALSLYPSTESGSPQNYTVRATKVDSDQTVIQNTPALQSADAYTLDFFFKGTKPLPSSKPFGRNFGRIDNRYLFASTTEDEDYDLLSYKFYWGNGDFSDWLGPVNSEQTMITTYSWHMSGTYPVHVIVKDETGLISEWSEGKTITIREDMFEGNQWFQGIRENILDFIIRVLMD